MNVELMVSIWPTVEDDSENFPEMLERGLLIRHDRGVRVAMQCKGDITHFDATNPEARKFVWETAKRNYYSKGIKVFWLDEAEPEYSIYDFDIFRYHAGSNMQIGNIFPKEYARGFYEGMEAEGQTNIVNLLRCAWAGSQKFGALVWSGDIASSWGSFRNQLAAGLNMGLAGIPWWTTDIGGFHGGDPDDPAFRELFTRWFQWGHSAPSCDCMATVSQNPWTSRPPTDPTMRSGRTERRCTRFARSTLAFGRSYGRTRGI